MANLLAERLDIPNLPHLFLGEAVAGEEAALYAAVDSNRCHLRYQPWTVGITSVETAADYLQQNLRAMAAGHRMQYRLRLRNQPEAILGSFTLHGFNPIEKEAQGGYWLVESATGQGYAQEAMQRLIAEGRDALGLRKLKLNILPGNIASERLAGRLGAAGTCSIMYEPLPDNRWQALRTWSIDL